MSLLPTPRLQKRARIGRRPSTRETPVLTPPLPRSLLPPLNRRPFRLPILPLLPLQEEARSVAEYCTTILTPPARWTRTALSRCPTALRPPSSVGGLRLKRVERLPKVLQKTRPGSSRRWPSLWSPRFSNHSLPLGTRL